MAAAQVIDVRFFEPDAHQPESGNNFATIDSDRIVIELHNVSPTGGKPSATVLHDAFQK
jgi:hypothetical protein